MSLTTYLLFDGKCSEAFGFYQSVFDGEILLLNRYAEGPPEMNLLEEDADRVLHATLRIGSAKLQGADLASNHPEPLEVGNNFSVVFSPESRTEADSIFPKLAEGGIITMALQETFWGSYFGMCTDRFDIKWMFNLALTNEP